MSYKARLADPLKPRWIITSNFETIRIYDQAQDATDAHPQEIRLEDLPDEWWRLSFITDKENSRIERERKLSVEAGGIVADLYGHLSRLYRALATDPKEQESLSVLIVRLVFLLFAEDAGLLQKHDAFSDYLRPIPADQLRQALADLFCVLDTPEKERDPYLPEALLAFPYVNGGIFADETIVIPRLDENIRLAIYEAAGFDYVIGNRLAKCPFKIAKYELATGEPPADGETFDLEREFAIDGHRVKRRVACQYREKRAQLDLKKHREDGRESKAHGGGQGPLQEEPLPYRQGRRAQRQRGPHRGEPPQGRHQGIRHEPLQG